MLIEVLDPVAGFSYTIDSQNKVVHRTAFTNPETRGAPAAAGSTASGAAGATAAAPQAAPARLPGGATSSGDARRPRPEVKDEDLGQQMIEGVMAQGRRITQSWPAGSEGNDRPFETVSEMWFSPELKETLLNKSLDPRSGEFTTKLINISRSEPAPELFTPPPDYSVVDETGPFQIHWTGTRQ